MTGSKTRQVHRQFPSRNRSPNSIAEQVAYKLLGDYTIDNEKTQEREFYSDHKLVHSRLRIHCNGEVYALWGSFPCA